MSDSDSGSDMPEEISFKTAKKQQFNNQSNLKQQNQGKKKKQAQQKTNQKKQQKQQQQEKELQKEQLKQQNPFEKLAEHSKKEKQQEDDDLVQLLKSELPKKKIKELEGKYSIVDPIIDDNNNTNKSKENQQDKNSNKQKNKLEQIQISQEIKSKKIVLDSAPLQAQKNISKGVKVIYNKAYNEKLPEKPVDTQSQDFMMDQILFGNGKRRVGLKKILGSKKRF